MEHDLLFNWNPGSTGIWMTVLCAFLPAIRFTFAAISSDSDVQSLAQRSIAMEEMLTQFQTEFGAIRIVDRALNSIKLRSYADCTTELTTTEMLDWHVFFHYRH